MLTPLHFNPVESDFIFSLTGCNTGSSGADIQGPVHRQRGYVETNEESGSESLCVGLCVMSLKKMKV